jgi:DNA-directed RNA polymerase subunit RPC12/RpoP
MVCPYCGGRSVAGPLPVMQGSIEMYCMKCRRNFDAFEWFGAPASEKRPAVAV